MSLKTLLAALVAVAGARTAMADTTLGQTPLQAQIAREHHTLAAQLRQAWVAAGKPLPQDPTPPTITAGKILSPTVNVARGPASPKVGFQYTTGSAGLYSVQIYFVSATAGQVMDLTYYTQYGTPPPTGGTLVLEQPVSNSTTPGNFSSFATSLGNYAAPGTWSMTEIYITDAAGNETYYGPPQIAQIFPTPSFVVANPLTPDTTKPVVKAGTVVTPVVSLSAAYPVFQTTLTVGDDLSGVHDTSVLVAPPGQTGGYGSSNPVASPVRRGVLTSYTRIDAGSPTGIWTITGYQVCDVAGNCQYDSSPADVQALFGTTTFTVTN